MNEEFEKLQKEWEGKNAFIIGGGPSVNGFPLSPLIDRPVIGVNNAYQFPATKILWFGDRPWYLWNEDKLQSFRKPKATCHPFFNNNPEFLVFKRGKPQGIDTRTGHISWNSCSGGSAVNLAWHLKAERVILIGFDMAKDEKGNTHYHKDHKKSPANPPYKVYLESFWKIAGDAKHLGFEIFNASPQSSMDCFPKITSEEALSYGF